MSHQEIWDYANSLGALMFIRLGFVLTTISLILYFAFPDKAMMVVLFSTLIGIGVGMYWCETKLNSKFDKNGNPK